MLFRSVLVLVILFDILINLQSSFAVRFICKNLFIIGLAMVLVLAVAYLNNPDLGILKKIDDFMNGRLSFLQYHVIPYKACLYPYQLKALQRILKSHKL